MAGKGRLLFRNGWLKVYGEQLDDGNVLLHFRHNKWHPGYWYHHVGTIILMQMYRIAPWLWKE